jgi:hypothetical protein
MRWIALVLLAANLGLAGWIVWANPGQVDRGPQPPPQIGELELLREADRSAAKGTVEKGARSSTCYTLGPFDSADQAGQAQRRLSELGIGAKQRTTEDEEVSGYQVLLPQRESRQAAVETTRRLAEEGIQDYFIITEDPERRNAISVGLFEQKRHAVQHIQYLEELGFDPEMGLRNRTRTRYWQDYRDPQGQVTAKILKSLGTERALQRLERPCPE